MPDLEASRETYRVECVLYKIRTETLQIFTPALNNINFNSGSSWLRAEASSSPMIVRKNFLSDT